MRRRRGWPRKFVRGARGALESLPAAGRPAQHGRRKREELSTFLLWRAGRGAHRISESKALIDFGRWIALQAEFCFDQSEDYSKDDSG
jgi:hypothetical protein